MLRFYLKKLMSHEHLTAQESQSALEALLSSKNAEQIAAFLVLMRAKGETVEEMTAFARALQARQVSVDVGFPVLDIVGTGGDGAHTANISTSASILIASCGVPVLKHGNRAASSLSGAADVLEALGINIAQTPEQVTASVKSAGIGFCFSPSFHPSFLALKPIRTQLGVPTFFNMLGPILNPGHAEYRLLGVFDRVMQPLMADVLVQLGIVRGMVVHGNGLDELSCLGPCDVIEISNGTCTSYTLDPAEFGLRRCQLSDLVGGDPEHNAVLLRDIVDNKPSLLADTVIFNAAVGVYLYGKVRDIQEGLTLVRQHIANGDAKKTLARFVEASHA